MARLILVTGKQGSGKTTGIRNMDPNKTFIIQPNTKAISFAGGQAMYKQGKNLIRTSSLLKAKELIMAISKERPDITTILLEDFTHFMNKRTLTPSFINNEGYRKWGTFGVDVFSLVVAAADEIENPNLNIILHGHVEQKDDGTINMKTSGKLLDREVDIPSYTTYHLYACKVQAKGGKIEHVYMTNGDGLVECKTPMGYFNYMYYPNDMAKVIERIEIMENLDPEKVIQPGYIESVSEELDKKQYPDFDFSSVN